MPGMEGADINPRRVQVRLRKKQRLAEEKCRIRESKGILASQIKSPINPAMP